MEISTTDYQELNRQILQTTVDNMTMEEIISALSVLASKSAYTEENVLFLNVLTIEYNKRKKQ